ncbi:MAG: TolC family protein [Verrucomicrobia bacterium]|nr:TolC family protein [Verrucomicrobiota bacterium]
MRFIIVAALVVGTLSPWNCPGGEGFASYGAHPLARDGAVQLALRQNPSVLSAVQELKRQRGLVLQAQSSLLPQLVMSGTYSKTDKALLTSGTSTATTPNFDLLAVPSNQPLVVNTATGATNAVGLPINQLFGSSLGALNKVVTDTWVVQLTLSQTLWNGGANIAARRQARISEDASYYQLRDTVDQVVANVRTQFDQILLDRALIQVQEESVNLLQSQLADQRSRFEAGTVPQFNVLQAETQLENQIPQLITARNNYRIAQLNLARTLGISVDVRTGGDEPLPVIGTLMYNPIQYDLASALAVARANRPFLKVQRSNVLAGVENITVQAAGFQPTFTANAGLEQRSDPLSNNLRDTREGWFLGLSGNWDIFDGLNTYGRVKSARASLEQAKATFDDSVHQVELEVATAVSNLRNSQETIVSTQKAIQEARESLRLANERLGAGTGTQLDVLNAQTQLTTAQTNFVQAEYNYSANVIEYQRSTATEVKYNDQFDSGSARPSTLTAHEAHTAAKFRRDSPLDSDKPATAKSKRISLTPPAGKVYSGAHD